jgi:hypothetical protein
VLGSVRTLPVPRPEAVDLHLEREAEHDSNNDEGEHSDALERRIDNDRPNDVRDDEHLESEQDAAAEIAPKSPIGPSRVATPAAPRRKNRKAPSPPKTMIAVPTVSTPFTTFTIKCVNDTD